MIDIPVSMGSLAKVKSQLLLRYIPMTKGQVPTTSNQQKARQSAGLFCVQEQPPQTTSNMFHLFRHHAHPCQPWLRPRRRSRRKLILISLAGIAMALSLASCSSSYSDPPPPRVTDTQPIGKGLSIIGYSILGGMLVFVFGSMVKR